MSVGEVMVMVKVFSGVLFCAFYALGAHAGPFGIQEGENYTKYDGERLGDNVYTITPPNPHSEFGGYIVKWTKICGITKVVALGDTVDADATGTTLRRKYDEFAQLLSKKYGEGNSYEYLNHDSIWDSYSDWMMAINVGDRTHTTYWIDDNDSFPDNLDAIELTIKAEGSRAGYLTLGYEFNSHSPCLDKEKAEENDVL